MNEPQKVLIDNVEYVICPFAFIHGSIDYIYATVELTETGYKTRNFIEKIFRTQTLLVKTDSRYIVVRKRGMECCHVDIEGFSGAGNRHPAIRIYIERTQCLTSDFYFSIEKVNRCLKINNILA